mmetsp:Transcript_69779/g.195593  ORF Transcript_69779/g.195593 Transcript_69779/m.195593 type:complete len:224 (-) Transcript_69779:618-1289(-)
MDITRRRLGHALGFLPHAGPREDAYGRAGHHRRVRRVPPAHGRRGAAAGGRRSGAGGHGALGAAGGRGVGRHTGDSHDARLRPHGLVAVAVAGAQGEGARCRGGGAGGRRRGGGRHIARGQDLGVRRAPLRRGQPPHSMAGVGAQGAARAVAPDPVHGRPRGVVVEGHRVAPGVPGARRAADREPGALHRRRPPHAVVLLGVHAAPHARRRPLAVVGPRHRRL